MIKVNAIIFDKRTKENVLEAEFEFNGKGAEKKCEKMLNFIRNYQFQMISDRINNGQFRLSKIVLRSKSVYGLNDGSSYKVAEPKGKYFNFSIMNDWGIKVNIRTKH